MGQGEQDVALGLYGKNYQIDLAESIPQSEKNQTYLQSFKFDHKINKDGFFENLQEGMHWNKHEIVQIQLW